MSTQHSSPLGTGPNCTTASTAADVLIEHETSDGQDAVWTDCLECRVGVTPA